MEFKQRYKSLNHALKYLKVQVLESLPYASTECPKLKSPEAIFTYLKSRTCYKHDPKGIELFQTLPTLMENNFHGKPGAGDCDCFTIAALALLVANGFDKCGIVLVGRNPNVPVHIYAYVDYNGTREYLDLTNKYYNFERSYPYKQSIPLVLTQNEKQMYLQLASPGKLRSKMLYLPKSRAYVPEKKLDTYHINDFSKLLGDNGFSLEEISELAAKRQKRKASEPPKRQVKKTTKKMEKEKRKAATPKGQKKAAKVENKKAKAELKRAKADKKRMKGEASVNKSQKEKFKLFNRAKGGDSAGGDSDEPQESGVDKAIRIFDSAGNAVAKVRGKAAAYRSGGDNEEPEGSEVYSGESITKTKSKKDSGEGIFSGSFDVFGINIPKPVAYIGGAAAAFGLYKLATRNSK